LAIAKVPRSVVAALSVGLVANIPWSAAEAADWRPKAPAGAFFEVPLSYAPQVVLIDGLVRVGEKVATVEVRPARTAELLSPDRLKVGPGAARQVFFARTKQGGTAVCTLPYGLLGIQRCLTDVDSDGRWDRIYQLSLTIAGPSYFGGPALRGPVVPDGFPVTLLPIPSTAFPPFQLTVSLEGAADGMALAVSAGEYPARNNRLETAPCTAAAGGTFHCGLRDGAEFRFEPTGDKSTFTATLLKPFKPEATTIIRRDVQIRYF